MQQTLQQMVMHCSYFCTYYHFYCLGLVTLTLVYTFSEIKRINMAFMESHVLSSKGYQLQLIRFIKK